MHFVIHCLDHQDQPNKRLEFYEDHKAYLAAASVKTVISGPLLCADNETMIGSMFLVEAENIEQVRAFNTSDPFNVNQVWAQISIHPFNKRVDNR